MKSKKLKFTIFSLALHVAIFVLLLGKGAIDSAMLGIWFGSFNLSIGIYTGANVLQKKIISQNYRSELEGK